MKIVNLTRRLVVHVGTSIAIAVSLTGCVSNYSQVALDPLTNLRKALKNPDDGVMVVAHRSCWRSTAENSVPAVKKCVKHSIDFIEVDVHKTSDGHLVSIHDDTVDRTTNGTGYVKNMTLKQISDLRLRTAAGGPGSELTEWRVPLLRDMLLAAKDKVLVNLDVKEEIYDDALTLVEELDMTDQVLIKMVALPNDPRLINAAFLNKTFFMPIVRQCRPEKAGMICSEDLSEVLPDYKQFNPIAYEIVFHEEAYLVDGIPEMAKQGKRYWVNTLQKHHAAGHQDPAAVANPDAHWGHLIKLGAGIIQTDNPMELRDYLEKTKQNHSKGRTND